jgi:hypothetical protein
LDAARRVVPKIAFLVMAPPGVLPPSLGRVERVWIFKEIRGAEDETETSWVGIEGARDERDAPEELFLSGREGDPVLLLRRLERNAAKKVVRLDRLVARTVWYLLDASQPLEPPLWFRLSRELSSPRFSVGSESQPHLTDEQVNRTARFIAAALEDNAMGVAGELPRFFFPEAEQALLATVEFYLHFFLTERPDSMRVHAGHLLEVPWLSEELRQLLGRLAGH